MAALSKAFDAAEAAAARRPADWSGVNLAAMRAAPVGGAFHRLAIEVVQRLIAAIGVVRPVIESAEHAAWQVRADAVQTILDRNPPAWLVGKLEAFRGNEPSFDAGAAETQAAKTEAIAAANAFFGT